MSTALDMSLDDIIKANKSSSSASRRRGGRGGGGGGGGGGPTRRVPARLANRSNPYSFPKAADYGVYTDQLAAFTAPAAAVAAPRASSIETGTKLYISNLDYGVSNDDIKELFSEVGDLKRYTVHYDRSGRSKGTAEVVFSRREHAAAAVKRYNNVQLDGKPMKIEVVGTTIEKPVALTPVANGMLGYPTAFPKSGRGGKGGFSARPRPPRGGGGGGGGRGQSRGGRNRGRGRGTEKVSAADLDADLDKYHQEAMQIN